MQSRRDLAKFAFTGVAAAVALPVAAARAATPNTNIIFTKEDPGHWAGKEATHVPQATVTGTMLMVKTPHPMTEAHYIVSHSVVLEGGKYLDRKVFTPKDQPESMFTLPDGYKGKVWIMSTCNLHDWWMATITV